MDPEVAAQFAEIRVIVREGAVRANEMEMRFNRRMDRAEQRMDRADQRTENSTASFRRRASWRRPGSRSSPNSPPIREN